MTKHWKTRDHVIHGKCDSVCHCEIGVNHDEAGHPMTPDDIPDIPTALLGYLALRSRDRAGRVRDALAALTPREQALVRDAAVMGYVRGAQAVAAGSVSGKIPADSAIVAEVVGACLSLPDLYPTLGGEGR